MPLWMMCQTIFCFTQGYKLLMQIVSSNIIKRQQVSYLNQVHSNRKTSCGLPGDLLVGSTNQSTSYEQQIFHFQMGNNS